MHSRSDLEIKLRLVLGLGLLSLLVFLLLRLLLPVLAIAGFIAGGYWLWQQYRNQQQRYQRQQARIHAQFYQLLRQQHGRISVLDFAMRTRLSGADAQDYLNTQAQAFSAFFETTLSGDLIYVFNSTHADRASQAQAYQTRVQEERVQAERAHAQQAQTAWTNAKQIRTLRQLSKRGNAEVIREQIIQVAPPQIEPGRAIKPGRSTAGDRPTDAEKVNSPKADSKKEDRYINIDIEQTEVESSNAHAADHRTIDVTSVRS